MLKKRFLIFLITTASVCLLRPAKAQHVPNTVPKKWLPDKSYTLADPAVRTNKPAPTMGLFSTRFTAIAKPAGPIATGTNTLGWGWFCHFEHRFRQNTRVPLYVRLGSVEQTNRLEGKYGSR